MSDILNKIVAVKREEVAAAIKRIDRKNSECRNPLGIRHGRR